MSCDVHGFVEVRRRIPPNGDTAHMLWDEVVALSPTGLWLRNYDLFAAVFGCRVNWRKESPLSAFAQTVQGRGVPDDASHASRTMLTSRDHYEWHDTTWLSFDELYTGLEQAAHIGDWRFIRDMAGLFAKEYGPDAVRIVVGFEN